MRYLGQPFVLLGLCLVQLLGHVVVALRQVGQLVVARHCNAVVQLAPCERIRALAQRFDRAYPAATEPPGEGGCQHQTQ